SKLGESHPGHTPGHQGAAFKVQHLPVALGVRNAVCNSTEIEIEIDRTHTHPECDPRWSRCRAKKMTEMNSAPEACSRELAARGWATGRAHATQHDISAQHTLSCKCCRRVSRSRCEAPL